MKASERNRLERLVATLSLGLSNAIGDGVITIDEASRLLFSPATMRLLKDAGVDKAIIAMIHAGTELDDIQRLLPDRFASALEEMKREAKAFLSTTAPSDPGLDNWLRQLSGGGL